MGWYSVAAALPLLPSRSQLVIRRFLFGVALAPPCRDTGVGLLQLLLHISDELICGHAFAPTLQPPLYAVLHLNTVECSLATHHTTSSGE